MATAILKDTYGFLRWRLVPVRMLGKLKNTLARPARPPRAETRFDRDKLARIENDGIAPATPIAPALLDEIREKYMPRAAQVVPRTAGHPFENVMRAEDFTADDPVFRLAFSEEVLGAADAYFDGHFLFDSIQVLHSFPTEGKLRASQMWHKDYGDIKSLHLVMYVNDVEDDADGPFVYIDRQRSKSVARRPIIRRLSDDDIAGEIGGSDFQRFFGKAGEGVLVDPSACYHYGSRCRNGRTAVFVTFNTATPYEPMQEPLKSARRQAAEEARKVRPDLPGEYIDAILEA
ncbi:hypothetical protein GCM10010923_23330 [Blastomonas marina]|uniref:Phytanoyl-CoA dioxygenase n=1 Tax=Blastomonas marina TaxID=1867408 RepID=A0ABQ1FGR0_9SPHN|nr:hypothetical protein [Blastomonas marina]GGA11971.1 hypothetical protein GCM10010923_23330 [Blastomonas marina]